MRKFTIGLILALAVVGLSPAQGMGQANQNQNGAGQGGNQAQTNPNPLPPNFPAPVAKSLEGKLAFVDDMPVLQTKDKSYLIEMPRFYYYAYTEGFKVGDQMKLDGYELGAAPGQDKPVFLVTKLVINGKTFDFTAAFAPRGGPMGGMIDGPEGATGPGFGGERDAPRGQR